jgi:hypothetical protein
MKVLSLYTAIFSAFVASRARASGAAATYDYDYSLHDEEEQMNKKANLYLRQNNQVVNPNDLIATSDSDADESSSATAQWLFADGEEEVKLSQDEKTTGGPNWTVSGCCGRYETIFLCCFAAYLVVIKLLWNTFIMKPMKLVAVFVHGKCVLYELLLVSNSYARMTRFLISYNFFFF